MNYTISIDRSSPRGSWALYQDQEQIAYSPFEELLPRSPTWFPAIIKKLNELNLTPASITTYLVGTGPGSFSGIRAVISAIQGLALPTSAPVLGLLSVAATAYHYHKETGKNQINVLGDARRGTLWLASYDFSPATTDTVKQNPILTKPDKLTISPDAILLTPEEKLTKIYPATLVTTTAADIADLYFAYPEAALRDPLPAYLHPAVS